MKLLGPVMLRASCERDGRRQAQGIPVKCR